MARSPEQEEIAIQSLRESRDSNGRYPPGRVAEAAEYLGKSTSTVYRWAEVGIPKRKRSAYELSRKAEEAFAQCHGRMRPAYRRLLREEEWSSGRVPSLSTFERAVKRTFSESEIAFLREGEPARIRNSIYIRNARSARNEIWQCDTVDLDMVALVKPSGTTRRRIKLTLVLDDSTRAIMGWSMSFSEDKASILTAMASALSVREGCGPFGGIPDVVFVDNQLSKTSKAIREAAVLVGFSHVALKKHAPWLKGKVEKAVDWVNQDFSSRFAHYTKGRQNSDGTPRTSRHKPPSIALVAHEFEAWVQQYNTSHPVKENGDLSPLAAWEEQDEIAVREIRPEVARVLLQERVTKTVGRQGIRHDNRFYVHPDITDRVGQKVTISWMPRDYRTIQVYKDNAWICEAKLDEILEPEEEQAVRDANAAEGKRLRAFANQLIKSGQVNIAPITGAGEEAVVTDVMSRRQVTKQAKRLEPAHHKLEREANRRRASRRRGSSGRNRPIDEND